MPVVPAPEPLDPATRAAHGGPVPRPHAGPVVPPIVQSSMHGFGSTDDLVATAADSETTGLYTRWGNPTVAACEAALADLEGAEQGLCFASGMAAIATTLLAHCRTGDRLVMLHDQYGGSTQLAREVLARFGVTTEFVHAAGGLEAIADALPGRRSVGEGGRAPARVLYVESPTNPCNRIVDLREAAKLAHDHGALAVIDGTVATPIGQQPLAAGFDLVCHSATKALAGHSDLIAGVVCGSRALCAPIAHTRKFLGGVLDPHAAFLLHRGLRTLAVRVERACANAQAVAEFLASHPRVRRVHYCGLPSHPGHAIAAGQMRHFGMLLAFDVDGDAAAARRVVDALRVFTIAASLGGVESLAVLPAATSHLGLPRDEREAIGVLDETVRLSIGIEAAADLIADLSGALARA